MVNHTFGLKIRKHTNICNNFENHTLTSNPETHMKLGDMYLFSIYILSIYMIYIPSKYKQNWRTLFIIRPSRPINPIHPYNSALRASRCKSALPWTPKRDCSDLISNCWVRVWFSKFNCVRVFKKRTIRPKIWKVNYPL